MKSENRKNASEIKEIPAQKSEKKYSLELVANFVQEVNELEEKIGEAVQNFESIELEKVHDLIKSMDKVETNYKLMMNLRQELLGEITSELSRKL